MTVEDRQSRGKLGLDPEEGWKRCVQTGEGTRQPYNN